MRRSLSFITWVLFIASALFLAISFWAGFVGFFVLGCAGYLVLSPFVYSEKQTPSSISIKILSIQCCSAILVTDGISSKDISPYVWTQFLTRYFGGPACISLSSGEVVDWDKRRIVFISDAFSDLSKLNFKEMVQFVENGGILILEGKPADNWVRENAFTSKIEKLSENIISQRQRMGNGVVLVLKNISGRLRDVRNGAANPLKKRSFWEIGILNSFDYALPHILHTSEPWADRLEASLLKLIREVVSIPILDPFNGKGVLTFTHDEDHLGIKMLPFFKTLSEFGIRPTLFVVPDTSLSKQDFKVLKQMGVDIGLHWNRFPFQLDRRGFHKNPYRYVSDQVKRISELAQSEVVINRTHWFCFKGGQEQHFNILTKAGIRADSSHGAYKKHQGPVFGSRYPFYKMDNNGQLLNVLEIPFELYDPTSAEFDSHFQKVCIERREPLTILMHPHYYLNKKGKEALKTMLEIYKNNAQLVTNYSLTEIKNLWENLSNNG